MANSPSTFEPIKSDAAAIEFSRFGLAYTNSKTTALQVLDDLNLRIRDGEFVTIVGPSGCGKTTLLRAVAGLLLQGEDHVTLQGELKVHGLSPTEAKRRRMFAFTFQNPVLLPWRTVHDNVALPLELHQEKAGKQTTVVRDMLSMVGIGDFESAMTGSISGGMQQRVNLARALVQEPKVLLMDEPFGSLDEVTRERLNFELLKIHRLKGQTILFVTHSLSEAALLGDRILILSKRPATVRCAVEVNLPRNRTEDTLLSQEYLTLVRNVRQSFAREDLAK